MLQKSTDYKIFKKGCTISKTNKTPTNQRDGTGLLCFFRKNSYVKCSFLPNETL